MLMTLHEFVYDLCARSVPILVNYGDHEFFVCTPATYPTEYLHLLNKPVMGITSDGVRIVAYLD